MKRLFFRLSISALLVCFSIPSVHAMEMEPADSPELSDDAWHYIVRWAIKDNPPTRSALHCVNHGFTQLTFDSFLFNLKAQKILNIDEQSLCSPTAINDIDLNGLKKLTTLTRLDLEEDERMTDLELGHFFNLTELSLRGRDKNNITDNGISSLNNLKSLDIWSKQKIKNIRHLTNLTELALGFHEKISNDDIRTLTNLTSLQLGKTIQITDDVIINCFPRLTNLGLMSNEIITGSCIFELTNLTKLGLCDNSIIRDNDISRLFNLRILDLNNNNCITGECFPILPGLTKLDLSNNSMILNNHINKLTNLKTLKLGGLLERNITDDGVYDLTNLATLNLAFDDNLTDNVVSRLTNLRKLNVVDNEKITNNAIYNLTNLTCLIFSKESAVKLDGLSHLTNLTDIREVFTGK